MAREPELPVSPPSASNLEFVEKLYYDYLADPASVDESWRRYFDMLPQAPAPARPARGNGHAVPEGASSPAASEAFQAKVDKLIQAYREYGHLRARLDPLGLETRPTDGFPLSSSGLSEDDLDRPVPQAVAGEAAPATLRALLSRLEETYCRTLGVELAHLHDSELRGWLEERMERTRNRIALAPEVRLRLLEKVTQAESFEQFVGTRFLGAQRFSIEGAEGLIPLLELAIDRAIGHGVKDIVIGMTHRGRLNVLANVIGKPLVEIFAEFRDQAIVNGGTGDVKYHLGYSADRITPEGQKVHLSLAFNPSHLEWIDTVVQGRVRAKQDRAGDTERKVALPLLVHGDAAFAAQGIIAEALNLSQLDGYSVGGTVHVIANNQIGFTTAPREARSTTYASDVARMLQVPVFHVNGEDIEAIAQAVLLAVDFRQRFHRDVVIDLWCYRKHGHNEGDEPSFTQPVMYRAIAKKPGLRRTYADELVREGIAAPGDAEAMTSRYRTTLEEAFKASASAAVSPGREEAEGVWARYRGGVIGATPEVATAVSADVVRQVGRRLVELPTGFNPHPKLVRLLDQRAEMVEGKRPVDWGFGEALAFGTLAWEGVRVRLSGQDSRRGTFSHRHGVLFDYQSGATYTPLAHLRERQGPVELRDSPLSEAGVLGFDYGYSLEMPDALVVWEAQYGDFVNAAQVIIDQFLSSSEAKWNRLSGLTLLLPHGMEGQGPEHSSARLERFLALGVDDNWQVMNLTTPAQLFHALRRQVLSPWRKPLIVMSPKSLLRHPAAVSPLSDFTHGAFRHVLPDASDGDPKEITRVLLCSGKIYYELAAVRAAEQARHAAIVRLEQLYPLRDDELLGILSRYPAGVEVVWVQEEPRNMGAWDYVDLHLSPLIRDWAEWSCVSRPASASPAAGSATRHRLEQDQLVRQALGEPLARRARPAEPARAQEG